jgi:purine-cytosine permease-like protein
MTPIVQLYWLRVATGIIAGLATAIVSFLFFPINELSTLFNCISITIIVYFITYYIFKTIYKAKIEKQSKILTTGIGMYFFAWIAFFVLFYTIIRSAIPA